MIYMSNSKEPPVRDSCMNTVNDTVKSARQCMDFKLIKCDNEECLNTSCPLNKIYGENL